MSMHEFTDVTVRGPGRPRLDHHQPAGALQLLPRARTVDELVLAFKRGLGQRRGRASLPSPARGDKAFCTGGDQKQRMETGDYGPSESGLFEVDSLHRVIRGRTEADHRSGQRVRHRRGARFCTCWCDLDYRPPTTRRSARTGPRGRLVRRRFRHRP